MEFVKLKTRYYLDVAILRAGESAEILFTRAMAYCGDQETDGFIPTQALAQITPTKAKARASALVREGLWEPVDGGWVVAGWVKHQITTSQLEQKREAGRARVERHRAKKTTQASNAPSNAVTNGERCSTEVRGKREEAAAAATRETPLPPPVEILRTRLTAAKLEVRWDRLTGPDLSEIEALIETHGDVALVKSALHQHRPDSPAAFAQAWLAAWRNLPMPGERLRLVAAPACPSPGHNGTTAHCVECASERLEAGVKL